MTDRHIPPPPKAGDLLIMPIQFCRPGWTKDPERGLCWRIYDGTEMPSGLDYLTVPPGEWDPIP